MSATLKATAVALAMLVGAVLTAAAARADEQFVYRPMVSDGNEYRSIAYPLEAGPLLVLADTDVVIEAFEAPVSYWPITREYLADFKGRERVSGTVEIVDASGEMSAVTPEPFLLWYPDGVGAGTAELIRGEAVVPSYERYVQEARAASRREREYQRLQAEQQAAVEAWIKMAAERKGKDMPPPPPELNIPQPEPYRSFATEPREAAIVSLPAGRHTLRMRGADGGVIAGSEREIVSFGPLGEAVGYVIRPENRWTQPVFSFAPEDAIYATGDTALFFQPLPVVEYEARLYTRLFRPQSVAAADPSQTLWVPRGGGDDMQGSSLAQWESGVQTDRMPLTPFRVAQIPDASLGYQIVPFTPRPGASVQPDFSAMRFAVNPNVTRVGLLPDGSEDPAPGSERKIATITPPPAALVFLPALLPLLLGVAARFRPRRRASHARG